MVDTSMHFAAQEYRYTPMGAWEQNLRHIMSHGTADESRNAEAALRGDCLNHTNPHTSCELCSPIMNREWVQGATLSYRLDVRDGKADDWSAKQVTQLKRQWAHHFPGQEFIVNQ